MNNPVFNRIVNAGQVPTRADIDELLRSIAEPGKKQATKRKTVTGLFDELGVSNVNPQGFPLDLESFEAY
jgi:hypothetical protein